MPSGCPRPGNILPDELADAPCRPARALSQTGSGPDLFSALQKEARPKFSSRPQACGFRPPRSAPGDVRGGDFIFSEGAPPWPEPGDGRPCPAGPRATLPPDPPADRCAYSADKKSRHALFRRSGQGPAGKSRNKARTFPPLRTCGRAAQEKRRGYGKGATIITGEAAAARAGTRFCLGRDAPRLSAARMS